MIASGLLLWGERIVEDSLLPETAPTLPEHDKDKQQQQQLQHQHSAEPVSVIRPGWPRLTSLCSARGPTPLD